MSKRFAQTLQERSHIKWPIAQVKVLRSLEKCKIKPNYSSQPIEKPKSKRLLIPNSGKDAEQL